MVIVSELSSHTSYGLLLTQLVRGLGELGVPVVIRPKSVNEKMGRTPVDISARIVAEPQPEPWEVIFGPPHTVPTFGKRTVYFTMWESTRLKPHSVEFLNRAELVVVPCQWNKDGFIASGVTVPIVVCPLGYDSSFFSPKPLPVGPICFGAAGRPKNGASRKGIEASINAFLTAFPEDPDVRLKVKVFADDTIGDFVPDPRVLVTKARLSESEVADWYGTISCFINLSRGEGFGLMPLEAMACGRPVISPSYGGLTEYFSPSASNPHGIAIPHEEIPAGDHCEGNGEWCEPSFVDMVNAMRAVKRDGSIEGMSEAAVAQANPFTIQETIWKFYRILESVGAAPPVFDVVVPTTCRNSARKLSGLPETAAVMVMETVKSLIAGGVPARLITVINSYRPTMVQATAHIAALEEVAKLGVKVVHQQHIEMYEDCRRALDTSNPSARYTLFVEDDVVVVDGFRVKVAEWLRSHHWPKAATFINWNSMQDGEVVLPDKFWGTQCFAIDRTLTDKLPATGFPYPNHFQDRTWAIALGDLGVPIIACAPSLADHTGNDHSTYSDGCGRPADVKGAVAAQVGIVFGVVTYNRQDLIGELARGVGDVFGTKMVLNNGPRGAAVAPDGWTVVEAGTNLGCAGGWNEIIRLNPNASSIVISNDDVMFPPGEAQRFKDSIESLQADHDLILGYGYSCFAITRRGVERFGLFDENFWPAYYEDVDASRRNGLSGVSAVIADCSPRHQETGSSTLKKMTRADGSNPVADGAHEGRLYYEQKWGGPCGGGEVFTTPFGAGGGVNEWSLDKARRERLKAQLKM